MNHPDLTKIPILAFSGKAKSGKDAALSAIRNEWSLSDAVIMRINFADALKEEVSKACGVSVEYIDKHKDVFRTILQWWGTDFRRNLFGHDYWLNAWKDRRNSITYPGVTRLIVCTDVRFLNEVSFLKSLSAKVVRINRPVPLNTHSSHQSEIELDTYRDWDATHYNASTLLTFQSNIINIINKLNII